MTEELGDAVADLSADDDERVVVIKGAVRGFCAGADVGRMPGGKEELQLYKGLEMDLETAMQMAAACETITLTSEDHKEGVAAFREKRKADYKGI